MPTLQLPPIEALDQAAATLIARGEPQRLVDKALWALHKGVEILPTAGGFLVPSSNGAVVYRLDNVRGCSCPATKPCYHQYIISLIEEAQRHTMPRLDDTRRIRKLAAERATALMDELFA